MSEKPTYAGIYSITHVPSGKRYIGSSSNIQTRWIAHLKGLRGGNHHCHHLRRAWAKHGDSQFEFEILERCLDEPVILLAREQYWIDKFKKKLFNSRKAAEPCGPVFMNSEEGEAYREQLRKRQLGFWDRQPTVEKTCELCGKTFQTRNVYKPTRFCSKNCTQTNRIREGKENVPFKCGVCGKDFMGNKHKKPKTCSAFCGRLSKSPFRDPDIIPILERAANGEPYPSIASDYNCDGKDISRVVRRRCWKHIPIPKELEERLQRLFQDEHRLGKAHGSLTDDQVRGIKRRVRGGESYSRIAPDFGIGVMLISAIVNGKSYKWVQDDPPALPLS